MTELKSVNYPSFFLFPYHTDRTAWRPFGLPMILVVPHIRDSTGKRDAAAAVSQVRIYISEKGNAPVAGHDHVGIFKPGFEVFSITIPQLDLEAKRVPPNVMTYLDASGNTTTADLAVSIQFTSGSGIIGTIPYLGDAEYYDLSLVTIPTEQLPVNHYILNYEATYNRRIVSDNNELLCVENHSVTSTYSFLLNHPGEVLLMMVSGMPSLYFGTGSRATDSTVAFLRPFSEPLQDLHDEQNYLKQLNWVYNVAPEHVPYLGFLLGWELPYFPRSVDGLRKAVLRNIVKLQQLKGSKRAVRELFDLFGFVVNIANVWWTPDGKHFVAPGEALPQEPQYEIESTPTITTEPLLANFYQDGFGETTVPLSYRPIVKKVTIRAYVVRAGSAAHNYISNLTNELSSDFALLDYSPPSLFTTLDSGVSGIESLNGMVGSSTALVDEDGYVSQIAVAGDAPIFRNGLKLDYISNVLNISLSRHYQFTEDDTRLYVFATYDHDKVTVPTPMASLQSNRFDVEIITKDGDQVDPDVVLFLIDFLMSIKAFHSLLRKVLVAIFADDTYLVTDYSVGGRTEQDITTDAGQQQTPPEAIIPHANPDCPAIRPEDYGFRRWDIAYRERILAALKIEFDAWKAISLDCAANPDGQDRSQVARSQESSLVSTFRIDQDAPRSTLCNLNGGNFSYLGRVRDALSYSQQWDGEEIWRFKGCDLGLGSGVYYTYPTAALQGSILDPYLRGGTQVFLNSRMGRLYRAFDGSELRYTDGYQLEEDLGKRRLAIQRPSLGIQKDNLGFPGHRLPRLNGLLDDFTHGQWKLKPWDIPLLTECNVPRYQNPLHASLEAISYGEELVFDDAPYALLGNGVVPDISGLGGHDIGTGTDITSEDEITHSIYMEIAGGTSAVSFQGAENTIGTLEPDGVVKFGSARVCGSSLTDYADGYPSIIGWMAASETYTYVYFPASSDSAALTAGLDCPTFVGSTPILFSLSSQIVVPTDSYEYDFYRPLRWDCGCLALDCGTAAADVPNSDLRCPIVSFLQYYGTAENDQVEVEQSLVLPEFFGARQWQLDNPNSSLFELRQTNGVLDPKGGAGASPWPLSGSFSYKDESGTIYETSWDTKGTYFDLVTTTKEPRVWGEAESGRVVNREVYRRGTISTVRQVWEQVAGAWVLIAQGSEVATGEFKSTYSCRPPFVDPFAQDVNNAVVDAVEIVIGTE